MGKIRKAAISYHGKQPGQILGQHWMSPLSRASPNAQKMNFFIVKKRGGKPC